MFKARNASDRYCTDRGLWTKPWDLFIHKPIRAFLRTAEELLENNPNPEVWVTFQKNLKDDPSILEEFRPWPGWFIYSNGHYTNIYPGDGIVMCLDEYEDEEPFAIIQRKKIGPTDVFLITVIKRYQSKHMRDLGFEWDEIDKGWYSKNNSDENSCDFTFLDLGCHPTAEDLTLAGDYVPLDPEPEDSDDI